VAKSDRQVDDVDFAFHKNFLNRFSFRIVKEGSGEG
jgi:hypothetical protein